MRSIGRRTVLTAAGVTALAAALPAPRIAFAAESGATGGAVGRDRAGDGPGATSSLLSNIVASLAGSDETNSSPAVQDKLNDLYDQAAQNLADLITDPSTELFPGRPLGSSDGNLETTYQKLYEIAAATAMPLPSGATVPADLSGNTEVQQQVIDALRWVHEHYFADQDAGYYGNWYNWEIGIPTHVSRTLALLADEVAAADPDLVQDYV